MSLSMNMYTSVSLYICLGIRDLSVRPVIITAGIYFVLTMSGTTPKSSTDIHVETHVNVNG